MKAKVSLTGRLTRDVTNVYANGDGSAQRAIFTVAVNSYFNDAKNATKKEITDFIPCVDWSQSRIKLLTDWGKKGRLIHIEGNLDTFQAEPDENGKYPPQKIQVKVNELEFLDKKPDTSLSENSEQNGTGGTATTAQNIDLKALAALVAKNMLGAVNTDTTPKKETANTEAEAGLGGLI